MEKEPLTPLTKAVLLFQDLHHNSANLEEAYELKSLYRELEQECQILAYSFPKQAHLLDEEDCAEFLIWFAPGIERILCGFTYRGIPFEMYYRKLLRSRVRSFLIRRYHREQEEDLVIKNSYLPELFAEASTEDEGGIEQAAETGTYDVIEAKTLLPETEPDDDLAHYPAARKLRDLIANDATLKRRITTMFLTSSLSLTAPMVGRLSLILGIDELTIAQLFQEAAHLMEKEQHRREELEIMRNRHWRRALVLQAKLASLDPLEDKHLYHDTKQLLQWTRDRLSRRQADLRRSRQTVPHSVVAKLLNIPRGTVASSVHLAKKALDEYLQELDE